MERRILQFIAALRASGVRVSMAESQDAWRAVERLGVGKRADLEHALRATLIKERADLTHFQRLFPLFFGGGAPPTMNSADRSLSPKDSELLSQALAALGDQLNELLRQLLEGQMPPEEQVRRAAQAAGADRARDWRQRRWITRQALSQLGWGELHEHLAALLAALRQMGMSPAGLEKLRAAMAANLRVLADQVRHEVNAGMAFNMAQEKPPSPAMGDILDIPFQRLSQKEEAELREEVGRLAARLRTRTALRQKRGKGHAMDVKGTLRANVRTGGVPFHIVHKQRRKKPKFTMVCDVSTSMRPVATFLLMLIYQLQDQLSRTRAFAFIDHIEDISPEFNHNRPEVAIPLVFRRLPPGHYNTDLGASLAQLAESHADAVDGRTTLIFCGDGRNNYNDPRVDLVRMLARRARRSIWLNPEHPARWRYGDSDMPRYQPCVDAVFQVANLRQLSQAIDRIFL
jgi:uncharacterized protein with von Willebrand factor type A (vWA) domain